MNKPTGDAELIRQLGGPTKVANLLGYQENGRTQRVQNWMTRGIPSSVKVQFPKIFLSKAATKPKEVVA